ncbi:MAG: hypothetical protein AAGG01_09465, partial [Planctomycetota bacterium]
MGSFFILLLVVAVIGLLLEVRSLSERLSALESKLHRLDKRRAEPAREEPPESTEPAVPVAVQVASEQAVRRQPAPPVVSEPVRQPSTS